MAVVIPPGEMRVFSGTGRTQLTTEATEATDKNMSNAAIRRALACELTCHKVSGGTLSICHGFFPWPPWLPWFHLQFAQA